MIQALTNLDKRIRQGDIIRDVEYIESVSEQSGIVTISKIIFPLIVVLTQDCDLTWDYNSRINSHRHNNDKYLFSTIVAPLYNYQLF